MLCFASGHYPHKMFSSAVMVTRLVAVVSMLHVAETKTVVALPFLFVSHAKYHSNVARALTKRGHEVWLAVPTFILEKDYINTSDLNVIPYDTAPGLEETMQSLLAGAYFDEQPDKIFQYFHICRDIQDVLLSNQSFVKAIQEKKPDLVILDNAPIFLTMSVIPYKLGVPFAFLGSVYHAPLMRIPFSPAEVPVTILPYSNTMTFFQRLHNTLFYMLLAVHNPAFISDAVSHYAPEREYIGLDQLVNQAEIFIVDTDHVLDYPRPSLPNVKLIGGTAAGPAKALPPQFQSFMDKAKEGVVVVSFGGHVLHVPQHISDKVLKVLQQLPMKSVFRSNLTSPDPDKILTAPWIPQNDLLGHGNTRVFVSHCGNNGQYEALYHAVPSVAIPLFTDQSYNAERARTKGFAETLDLNTCTAEQMKTTILTVANEPRYKQAVVKHSRLFKELYGNPTETASYWLDHVMKYGGGYMRSAGQQMPWYQFMLLDIVMFIVGVLILIVSLLYWLIKALCSCVCKRKIKSE